MISGTVTRRSFVRTAMVGGLAAAALSSPLRALAGDSGDNAGLSKRLKGEQFIALWLANIGGNSESRDTAWSQLSWSTQQAYFEGNKDAFLSLVNTGSKLVSWVHDDPEVANRALQDEDVFHIVAAHRNTFGFGGLFKTEFLLQDTVEGKLEITGWNALDVPFRNS